MDPMQQQALIAQMLKQSTQMAGDVVPMVKPQTGYPMLGGRPLINFPNFGTFPPGFVQEYHPPSNTNKPR